MTGHLDLLCALDTRGQSCLRRQSFRAPMHLSKPHLDCGTLVVNVVNPTAGLFAGDCVSSQVHVEPGANLLLTTPSASRVHRTRGGYAEVSQEFSVAAGGFLEIWPELFIPHGGACYRQTTALRIEDEGELLFFETLAPGRVAHGEVFAYEALEWSMDLFVSGTLAARERYRLAPDSFSVAAMRAQFPNAYYASCFAVSRRLEKGSACWQKIHELHEKNAWVGCSRLAGGGGWVVKYLAASSILLRRKLAETRAILYEAMSRKTPGFRRVAGN